MFYEIANINKYVGPLLPHEAKFISDGLSLAQDDYNKLHKDYVEDITSRESRVLKYQTVVYSGYLNNSSLERVQWMGKIAEMVQAYGILPYPSPEETKVTYGSRLVLAAQDWTDTYDVATIKLMGLEPAEDVNFVYPYQPLGVALLNMHAGETVHWKRQDGALLSAKIAAIDQTAQAASYAAVKPKG